MTSFLCLLNSCELVAPCLVHSYHLSHLFTINLGILSPLIFGSHVSLYWWNVSSRRHLRKETWNAIFFFEVLKCREMSCFYLYYLFPLSYNAKSLFLDTLLMAVLLPTIITDDFIEHLLCAGCCEKLLKALSYSVITTVL